MITSRTQVTVRYAETDMMGIVYHANYLPWFEIGRTQLLKELGLPYRQLETDGYRLPVLEISAKYARPALYDDVLTIVTYLREKPLLRIRLDYEIFAARNSSPPAKASTPSSISRAVPCARPRASSR